ncbi:MAG: PTS sugar transporter subunit IIA [Pseudomonadota bacterium]
MPTSLIDLLSKDRIAWRAEATSRKQAISLLAGLVAQDTGVETATILQGVMAREKLGSTGVGDGVAIPHARIEGLQAPIGAFASLATGVDFEAVDDRPCDLIFMLLAPLSGGADHLRALAQVARVFRQAQTRDHLRRSAGPGDVFDTLCATPKGAAA